MGSSPQRTADVTPPRVPPKFPTLASARCFLKKLLRRRTRLPVSVRYSDRQGTSLDLDSASLCAWLASSAAYTYHTLARASFLTPFQDHSPAVSRLVATAALSADLASPDIATLPKLRLTIQLVKRSWELLSMHALRPSSTPDADCMGFLNRCAEVLAFLGLALQGLGHCRSVHFCHP